MFIFYLLDWWLGSDWVNPDDPNVIAENELLSAANAIEAAARKLALLKPRQGARVSLDTCCSLLTHWLQNDHIPIGLLQGPPDACR